MVVVVGVSRCGGAGLDMGNCYICWMTGGVSPLLSSGGCSLFRTLNTACPATYPARHCSAQYTPVKSGLGFNIEWAAWPVLCCNAVTSQYLVLDWFQENCSAPTKSTQVWNKVWGWAVYFGSVLSFNCGNIMVLKFYSAEPCWDMLPVVIKPG